MHEAKMLEKDVKYGIGMLQSRVYVHIDCMIIVPCVLYVHGIIQSELFIAIHACIHACNLVTAVILIHST